MQLTSTDAAATLPGNYTFVAGDLGVHTFAVTLKTAGAQTVTATDTVSSSITGSTGSITVTTGVNNAELNGNYAFRAAGYNQGNGAYYTVTGSFHANGDGTISGGEEDILTYDTPAISNVETPVAINSTGSGYSVLSDNRGTLTIATSQGTQTFVIAVGGIGTNNSGVAAHGRLIGNDLGLVISGEFMQQTVNLASVDLSGNYAFVAAGADGTGAPFGVVGETSLSGSAGSSGSGSGEMDTNNGGTLDGGSGSALTFTESYGAPDSHGRSAVTMDVSAGGTPVATIHMAQYAVTANDGFVVGTDGVSSGNSSTQLFTGRAYLRPSTSFGSGTLHGTSVLYLQGQAGGCGLSNCGSSANVGLLTTNGSGGFNVTLDQNQGGSLTLGNTITGGTYTVASGSSGRVTLSGAGNHPPMFYLVSSNEGVMLGTDQGVETGFFEPQTATSASGAFTFGTHPPTDVTDSANSGVVTLSSGNVTGTADGNEPDGSGNSVTSSNTISNTTYSIDGSGHVTITDTGSGTSQLVGYVVSGSKAYLIDVHNGSGSASPNPSVSTVEK